MSVQPQFATLPHERELLDFGNLVAQRGGLLELQVLRMFLHLGFELLELSRQCGRRSAW